MTSLSLQVFEALDLTFELYAASPDVTGRSRKRRVEEAFRDVLGYRVYHDLRRGWRITSPNLEQCGLLHIDYIDLTTYAADDLIWADSHQTLTTATPEQRLHVCQVLLDLLRRGLAIKVDYLDAIYQEGMKQRSSQQLAEPWAIDETERMTDSFIAIPASRRYREQHANTYLSPVAAVLACSCAGRVLFPAYDGPQISLDDTEDIIQDLFNVLAIEGLVDEVEEPRDEEDVPGYQLMADAMIWKAGDGRTPITIPSACPGCHSKLTAVRTPIASSSTSIRTLAPTCTGLRPANTRPRFPAKSGNCGKTAFREAKLPILYCSPTMELGVDISQLNVVNMRNVPPTPANYAQRSGRAGRSGQPALVFTYCTTGSPHDQYFFKRPSQMVAGAVRPPRLDLANEDLIRAHVHAVWLSRPASPSTIH